MKKLVLIFCVGLLWNCNPQKDSALGDLPILKSNQKATFDWSAANVYFLLTDRFENGDKTNDINLGRNAETGLLRGFEGGDLRGIIKKIDEGYFTNLGINAIWMTPLVEQIEGYTDEGTGKTYGFHGYWTKDWTSLDPNWGTEKDLKELVEKSHKKGIRIVLDAVINHTGPVTDVDPVYPNNWVRTSPQCTYDSYVSTVDCALVKNLPDVLTNEETDVELPPMLVEKWKKEGRYDQEIAELNAFFQKTGYPKAPKYYIMKWLADYITDYGIDGYRCDTVKHTEEDVWKDFAQVCQTAFDDFNQKNPQKSLGTKEFFMVGEVYNYGLSQKLDFNFPDKKVNYFANGFGSLINFDFKGDANKSYEELFSYYSNVIQQDMKGKTVMNYVSSHDDGSPFDKERKRTFEAGTKLLLSPGISQVYYGDESARSLIIPGTDGDATLRSFMNWNDIKTKKETQELLSHFQKLGKFRAHHPAIGAGVHQQLSSSPYWFKRTYTADDFVDIVIVGLDLKESKKSIDVSSVFKDGSEIRDAYSGIVTKVKGGKIIFDSPFEVVLLELK